MASGVLGLKIADRTFRFVHLERYDNGLRLTGAGAGLLPFTAKHRGQIRTTGSDDLVRSLERAVERAGVTGGVCTLVLDSRAVQRTILHLPADLSGSADLAARVEAEIRRRTGAGPEELFCRFCERGVVDGIVQVDAWGVWREVQDGFRQVVEAAGYEVAEWDCDGWALHRLGEYRTGTDTAELTAIVHSEAESLECALAGASCFAGATVLQSPAKGSWRRSWDPDNTTEVAAEILYWTERLLQRCGRGFDAVSRIILTGSVEEPERLLGALVSRTPARTEILALEDLFTIDSDLADTPLLRSNLGSFALPAGGALAGFPH